MTHAARLLERRSDDRRTDKKVGKPYNAADARHVDFPHFWDGVSLWWWALVVSDRASVITPILREEEEVPRAPLQAVTTNHPCIWYASFDLGLPTHSLGEGVVVRGRRWVP